MTRWVFSLVRPHYRLILLSLLGSLLQSIGTAGLTLTVKGIVDNVFILKDAEALFETVFLLFICGATAQLGFFISSFTIQVMSERIVKGLRESIFTKFLKAPMNALLNTSSGDFISRVVSDLEGIRQVFSDYFPKLLREPLVIGGLLGVLLYRDFFLTLILLLFVPIIYFLTKYFSGKKKKYLSMQREKVSELTTVIAESFRGIENIKIFLAEDKFLSWFKDTSQRFYKYSVKITLYIIGNTVFNYIFGYTVVAVLLLLGSLRIVKGDISAGDFVSYLTALFMIQKPVMDFQKSVMNLRGSIPLFERVKGLLELPQEKSGKVPFKGIAKAIKFEKVSVRVNGRRILQDITLKVKKGDKIGIRGHTGSGKSTFVRIIPRLLEYEGYVFYDNTELRDFDILSLRKAIGFVTQETFLFKGTVRENLLIAKPNATDGEMIKALELAGCNFVLESAYGLEYPIEEGGRNLSGGEKQRLAIARLFLKNPEVIILDEATSALDRKTEEKVLENLFSYFRNSTMFVVAHRESNLKYCNVIVTFEAGKIVSVNRLGE